MTLDQVEDPVIAPTDMEPQSQFALRSGSEGELHLVAVECRLVAGNDGRDRARVDAGGHERQPDHIGLENQLVLIAKVLPTAPAAAIEMTTEWLQPFHGRTDHTDFPTLQTALALANDDHIDHISRYCALDVDLTAVVPAHAVTLRRHAVNLQLDTITALHLGSPG